MANGLGHQPDNQMNPGSNQTPRISFSSNLLVKVKSNIHEIRIEPKHDEINIEK